MKAKVFVTLKNGVLDPQGSAIKNSLTNIGITSIESITQGKYFELNILENDKNKVEEIIEEACKNLLANTVIENYKYELV
ncbi:MAG: phosphoribosylformylglycinamidine synthase subunit PurS [Alphaproteobacteria bacterium]|jgi:phosphoribosylformylglycinamidine synthase subunit PurS|nr:phosphoribosylformylglycinamidine synthase subunit PurS [Alphaproteobacteria bacterium]MBT5827496.1 phosphoribosylformylglycinamidine synthase subunit PurS [Alphaproteobacteria bacterium]